MDSKILLLLAIVFTANGSFLQTPDQFQSTFNSTFLAENEKLFKPIIIPNITKSTEQPPTSKLHEASEAKGNETIPRKIPDPKEISQEVRLRENYLDEEPKTTGNSLKFSSRYSTKLEIQEDSSNNGKSGEEKPKEVENRIENTTTEIIKSEKNSFSATEKSFSDRSYDFGDSEEEKDDTSKSKEAEQSEIASTTNEPYLELKRPTSFRSTPYSEDDLENYETTSTSAEQTDSSEEKEEEDEAEKRSIVDYYNSDSKNYHSIQTPLKDIKYRAAHSYGVDFEPLKTRTRLVSPMRRYHDKPSWPYARPKGKIEELNEISEIDETELDVKEEFRTKPKQQLDLEAAVQKDEFRFARNKKYNHVEERKRRKQQQKNLAAEEEKDDKLPLFHSLKQYQVDEEPRYQSNSRGNSKFKKPEDARFNKLINTTPKNIFKSTTSKKPQQFGVPNEPTPNFHGKQFLGPVVFNHDLEQEKVTPIVKPKYFTTQKVPIRSSSLKGLLESEKLDQDNLTNQRSEKKVLKTGNKHSHSFNHLEESDEMYNAILANIQSVFGIRTQSLKSTSHKVPEPEVNLEESRSLTWSLPFIKRTQVN